MRVESLVEYFRSVPPEDAVWATWFLCGHRPRRSILIRQLQQWCAELAGIPEWLFEVSREFTGDLAETIALLLPGAVSESAEGLHYWVTHRLQPLSSGTDEQRRAAIVEAWEQLGQQERLVFNKLLTGGFRVGVSQKLVVRALAQASGVSAEVLAHRLMGHWAPTAAFFQALLSAETEDTDVSRPFPFCLAHALPEQVCEELLALRNEGESEQELAADTPCETISNTMSAAAAVIPSDAVAGEPASVSAAQTRLGPVSDWIVDWKWDGIRAQAIRRSGQVFLWSRGEELLAGRFPELERALATLPDGTVLDGEITAWRDGRLLPFAELQKRVHRRTASPRLQATIPVRFLIFDLLEEHGGDVRELPAVERRQKLTKLASCLTDPCLHITEPLKPESWADCVRLRESSREHQVEGLMLKRASAAYGVGRVTGVWWKWKTEPFHCDAVLLYAQRGHGRRAGRFTDFTFAVRDGDQLVPFAKAYSGLTKAEIEEVDRFVRDNTVERFGPVSSVRPELVFELAFEGMQLSGRHKSGIAVRFPRIARWRKDKRVEDADTLDSLKQLVRRQPTPGQQSTSEQITAEQPAVEQSTEPIPQKSAEASADSQRIETAKSTKKRRKPAAAQTRDLFSGLDDEA